MRFFELKIKTKQKEEIKDITHLVENLLPKGKGMCFVYLPHATAGLTINESADPGIMKDFLKALKKIAPEREEWLHNKIDNNATAHIKAGVIKPFLAIPFSKGKLMLGTWQSIWLCEFDGPRERRIFVVLIEDEKRD